MSAGGKVVRLHRPKRDDVVIDDRPIAYADLIECAKHAIPEREPLPLPTAEDIAAAETRRKAEEDERRAKDAAALASALAPLVGNRAATMMAPAPASSETIDQFFARLFAYKRKIGRAGSVRQDESRYSAWIKPRIGALPICAPREQLAEALEEVRDDLNDAVRAYVKLGKGKAKDKSRTSGKNAANIWGIVVTGFNYAQTAEKRSGLRVRTDNPCDGIRPPEKSPPRYKVTLRPVEFLALAACDEVPVEWRETYAVLLYTYMRPGEGRVLEWGDVDFVANMVRVCKAWDFDAGAVKPTKTWEVREIPIEPTLRPLLLAMHERAGGRGLVLPMLSSLADETAASKVFRRHLEAAGVTRPDLFAKSATPGGPVTNIAIRLRSMRDFGITWRLWRGDKPLVVQRHAGHKRFSTTEKYVGDIEALTAECGEPFPAIPSALVDKARGPGKGDDGGAPSRGQAAVRVRTEGVEPSRVLPRQNLNLVRLPIPPRSRRASEARD